MRSVTFIDLLFLLLLVLLATTIIRQPVRQSAVANKAEYIAILEWDAPSKSDIDLHMLSPEGDKIDFRQKVKGVYALERDDLGQRNDSVIRGGTRVFTLANEEIITLRGWVEGRYVFAVMAWTLVEPRVNGRVTVYRLNPSIRVITEHPFTLTAKGQEITAARITLDINGDVRGIDHVFQPIAVRK